MYGSSRVELSLGTLKWSRLRLSRHCTHVDRTRRPDAHLLVISMAVAALSPPSSTSAVLIVPPSITSTLVPTSTACGVADTALSRQRDTLRGLIVKLGVPPFDRLVLKSPAGEAFTLTGRQLGMLEHLVGVEVCIRGRLEVSLNQFEVIAFAVRSVDGVPAKNGLLIADGSVLALQGPEGQVDSVLRPTQRLRELVGSQVWIAGDLKGEPNSIGVIDSSGVRHCRKSQ